MSTYGTTSTREAILRRRARVRLLLARGWLEKEIAAELRISHRTVQRYKHAERHGIPPRTYPPGFGGNKRRVAP